MSMSRVHRIENCIMVCHESHTVMLRVALTVFISSSVVVRRALLVIHVEKVRQSTVVNCFKKAQESAGCVSSKSQTWVSTSQKAEPKLDLVRTIHS